MSKDQIDSLIAAIRGDREASEKEEARFGGTLEYVERSAMIVLGVTVTVLAGFLSQVWSSAGVAFRTELAELLQRAGNLFTLAFILPALRFLLQDNMIRARWRAVAYLVVWVATLLLIYIRFTVLLHDAGASVLKYAKIATP